MRLKELADEVRSLWDYARRVQGGVAAVVMLLDVPHIHGVGDGQLVHLHRAHTHARHTMYLAADDAC